MTDASISEVLKKPSCRIANSSRVIALLLVATFAAVIPARAQSSDTWKSVAIIGGSTAAGAYIGHKVGGTPGAYVGAAVGASTGYAIDRRRRENQYSNSEYGYGNSGYYGDNGGYYGNNDPYARNGGYYGNPRTPDSYCSGYPGNGDCINARLR